ncbi:hypothetical protein F5Y08DRAFT_300400 [Xylaria arbuscula]|nr:hypothetical protein F5Y08DRAFT_300400 [Xylaria arbuscula]
MADLPENNVPEQAAPVQPVPSSVLNPGESSNAQSSHHGGTVNRTSIATINGDNGEGSVSGSTSEQGDAPGNPAPFIPVNGTNGGHDKNDTEGPDAKDVQFPLPPTRHENTPEPNMAQQLDAMANTGANNGGPSNHQHPGTNRDGPNGDEEHNSPPAAPVLEQAGLGGQAENDVATHGSTNNQPGLDTIDESAEDRNGVDEEDEGDEDDEEGDNNTNTSTHNHSRGPPPPPGSGPQPPPSQGGSAGQASGTGVRDTQSGSNQSSSTNPSSSTQTSTQGRVSARSNSSLEQETGNNISTSTGVSAWDAETTTPVANTSEGSLQAQPHEASYLNRSLPTPEPLSGQVHPASLLHGSSSSAHAVARNFVPRPVQPATSQEFTLPRWQPDSEVNECPICGTQFSVFYRRHHCRKCGRVVCDRCSPHRITIPHPYIVRPPGDLGPASQHLVPGIEGSIADFSVLGGGERVRLCNPCVPDPNTTPPQTQRSSQPTAADGRPARTRLSSNSVSDYSTGPRPQSRHAPHGYSHSRTRSATTSTGQDSQYFTFGPYSSSSGQYSNPPYFPRSQLSQRQVSGARFHYPPPSGPTGRDLGDWWSASGSGLNRPLPRTPAPEREIPEEDACPICHNELPSRNLANFEILRESHINNCISTHSNYGGNRSAASPGPGNHGTPPPRTTRRTRMFPYVATEKDCVNDAECTICLEEFQVGDEMARLECFCRFHRSCIDSWFVGHPGRCPIHQHDSFGY